MRLATFYEQNLIPNWGITLYIVIVVSHVCDVRNLCFKRYIILVFYECKE